VNTARYLLRPYITQTRFFFNGVNPQEHLHVIEKWLKKWKTKVNESKSSHITLTLRKGHCPAVNINQTIIHKTEVVKYLGLHFDSRLN